MFQGIAYLFPTADFMSQVLWLNDTLQVSVAKFDGKAIKVARALEEYWLDGRPVIFAETTFIIMRGALFCQHPIY